MNCDRRGSGELPEHAEIVGRGGASDGSLRLAMVAARQLPAKPRLSGPTRTGR